MAFNSIELLANAAFLDDIPRVLISSNPSLSAFASQVARVREPQTMRVMHVDLVTCMTKESYLEAKHRQADPACL